MKQKAEETVRRIGYAIKDLENNGHVVNQIVMNGKTKINLFSDRKSLLVFEDSKNREISVWTSYLLQDFEYKFKTTLRI